MTTEWRWHLLLALKVPIIIENAEVVSKSYPDFWEDLKFLDFSITELKA
jgi:3-phosphoshikimate 1-carboxyvinyltransferase